MGNDRYRRRDYNLSSWKMGHHTGKKKTVRLSGNSRCIDGKEHRRLYNIRLDKEIGSALLLNTNIHIIRKTKELKRTIASIAVLPQLIVFGRFKVGSTVNATLNSTGDSTGEQRYANVKLATGLFPVDFTMFFSQCRSTN